MTVAIHSHHFRDAKGGDRGPGIPETDDLDVNPSVADYLPVFAKASIDAGADAFLGTGVHVLRGIEIYKGRPIFYGLGEFFRQMDVVGLAGFSRRRGGSNSPPIKYESIVPVSRFEGGTLAEIRLHPIELSYDVRMAHRGIPMLASPEAAQRILTRLQGQSAPYGTTITIEGNVGVIRP
jgi:poly-gamma-glutamate synthesis protein (capsule biosynthesis protein)